ncbi:hypothetical protein D3C80_1163870 [compost metagenome]
MEGWFTISDFTPNLWVKSITASGPTLSISFAEMVLIELASAFFKVIMPRYLLSEFLGSQSAVTLCSPLRIMNGESTMESHGDMFSCSIAVA